MEMITRKPVSNPEAKHDKEVVVAWVNLQALNPKEAQARCTVSGKAKSGLGASGTIRRKLTRA